MTDMPIRNDLRIEDEERILSLMYLELIKNDYIEGEGYKRHPLPEYYAIETAIKSLTLPSVTLQEPEENDEVTLPKKEYEELLLSEFHRGYAKGFRDALEGEGHILDEYKVESETK